MKYRYYIYRQAVFTNFNKYSLDQYFYVCEITPVSQWGLDISRDREWFPVIRREFNGQITVHGQDYNTLIALDGDSKQYAIVIYRECEGRFSEFWKGFFSYFDFKVDVDRCVLSFTPTVWDDYSPVFDQLPIERNILAAEDGSDIFMDAYEFNYETVSANYVLPNPFPAAWAEAPASVYSGSPNEYYLYSRISTYIGMGPAGTERYSISDEYRRDYAYTSGSDPGDAPPGPYWTYDSEPSPGQFKWVRRFLGEASTSYEYTVKFKNKSWVLQAVGSDTVTINGTILLDSVLEYFADNMRLGYVSNFFQDTPCPAGGPSLALTSLQQISNLRDTADRATKGMMTLKNLLTYLRDTFNVYWYIDSNGDFRLEHRSYFDYGLSYTLSPPSVELDLTTLYPGYIKALNRYEWSKPDIYRYEKIEFPYQYFADWTEAAIEYPQNAINGNESKIVNPDLGTDIIGMWFSKEDLPKKGFVLLDVYLTGTGVMFRKVRNTVGAYTGYAIQNGRFSPANLLRDYWSHGRLLRTGLVNNVNTTFDTIQRLRRQVEINIPACCQDIDYNGLFLTGLGLGLLDSAEYEAKSGNLKMNLIYE